MKSLPLWFVIGFTALVITVPARALITPLFAPGGDPLGGSPATHNATTPPAAEPKNKYFLIVLKLVTRLHDDKAWTKTDNAAVGAHFQRLKAAVAEGKVILAGRTDEPGDQTMGLVIFKAANEAEANVFMQTDPCVVAGVMTAKLHPYSLALLAK